MSQITPQLTLFQGEPFIKNSHLITQVLVYNNEQVLLFGDNAIFIFIKANAQKPSLISADNLILQTVGTSIIPLSQSIASKHHQNFLSTTSTQSRAYSIKTLQKQSQQIGQKIFPNPNDISSNIFIKPQHFLNRLKFLNDLRTKNIEMSFYGDLLIQFWNGKALLIRRNNHTQYYKQIVIIDLNINMKGKIQHCSFVSGTNHLLFYCSSDKVHFYDYLLAKQLYILKLSCSSSKLKILNAFKSKVKKIFILNYIKINQS